MTVLVWKSYGDIKVYAADTADQLEGIVTTMMSCMKGWGEDSTINSVKDHIKQHKGDRKEMLEAFDIIVDAAGEGHEMFEDVFLTDVKEILPK